MTTPHDDHPPPAPDPLAVELAKLDPAPHGFDWNALMFAAGRASKVRALWFWRAAAGACALAAAGLAAALFVQLARPPVERVVYIERISPAPPSAAPRAEQPPAVPVKPPAAEPLPPAPASAPAPWSFDPPPAQGAAARWLSVRNEVLTAGLGVLPDPGPKMSAPRDER